MQINGERKFLFGKKKEFYKTEIDFLRGKYTAFFTITLFGQDM
jgi:hypothetical protein